MSDNLKQSLWAAADKLRNNMSPADYKYVMLGLIFLKYISDAFDEQYAKAEKEGFDPEDRDFYTAAMCSGYRSKLAGSTFKSKRPSRQTSA